MRGAANKERHLFALFIALCMVWVMAGCKDGGDLTEPEPESCGGAGILCNVSGLQGELGLSGDNGPATAARHYWPMDVTVGKAGEVYVVDWNNHCVRKIDQNGVITRYIGSGNLGDTVGPADGINLNHPTSLTIGPDNLLYLAAWHNWKIKVIDPQSMNVTIGVGTIQGLEGDGGPAKQAKMDLPSSVVFGPDGSMYISDQGNQRVRKVDPQGMITTLAGGARGFADGIGTDAQFDLPKGPDATPGGKIAINQDGTTLYLADTNNNRIRKIDLATGAVTTIAGTGEAGYSGDGGPATAAKLNSPSDVYITHEEEIFVADSRNNVIRMIEPDGTISTVVGTGEAGFSPDATPAASAKLNRPMGVVFDEAKHTLYIADTFNEQVKRVEIPD